MTLVDDLRHIEHTNAKLVPHNKDNLMKETVEEYRRNYPAINTVISGGDHFVNIIKRSTTTYSANSLDEQCWLNDGLIDPYINADALKTDSGKLYATKFKQKFPQITEFARKLLRLSNKFPAHAYAIGVGVGAVLINPIFRLVIGDDILPFQPDVGALEAVKTSVIHYGGLLMIATIPSHIVYDVLKGKKIKNQQVQTVEDATYLDNTITRLYN